MDASIENKISEIMSDPEAMEQVRSLGKMLGLNPSQPEPEKTDEDALGDGTIGKLTSLLPIIQNARREDDTTRLLSALRPFLSDEKRKRLESAKKLLMIIKLFPALKEVGILEIFN